MVRPLRRSVPRDLATIIHKAVDRDLDRRYGSAAELAADLQRFLDDEPIKARRATEIEKLWMWARRRPGVAGLIAALVLCLLAGSITSTGFAIRAAAGEKFGDRCERQGTDGCFVPLERCGRPAGRHVPNLDDPIIAGTG